MYQLEGWDKDWKQLSASALLRYEQLPPGSYIFKTKAINTNGLSSQETAINFHIVPPFYKTAWFIIGMFVLIGLIFYLLYRYRLAKLLEMERLRTRIATDLHDDIGATLSSISMYSEVIKNQVKEKLPHLETVLAKMGENSRDMVTNMSDIVWAINPTNDDGEKLLQRMESYATDICATKNIRFHFEKDEKILSLALPLEHRKNLYLIFKEAVNNAVKYSAVENLWAGIVIKNNKLLLQIRDDGKGFNKDMAKKGNGLKNLGLRAAEIKGTLSIDTNPGSGTNIQLTAPI